MAKKISVSQLGDIMAKFRTGIATDKDRVGKNPPDEKKVGVPQVASAITGQDSNLALNVIKNPKKTVVILAPFMAEDPSKAAFYERYTKRAVKDSLNRNEAPIASQLFYYDFFNHNMVPIERDMGLLSQLSWIRECDLVAVYSDFGMTQAMKTALDVAKIRNRKIEYRAISSFA